MKKRRARDREAEKKKSSDVFFARSFVVTFFSFRRRKREKNALEPKQNKIENMADAPGKPPLPSSGGQGDASGQFAAGQGAGGVSAASTAGREQQQLQKQQRSPALRNDSSGGGGGVSSCGCAGADVVNEKAPGPAPSPRALAPRDLAKPVSATPCSSIER